MQRNHARTLLVLVFALCFSLFLFDCTNAGLTTYSVTYNANGAETGTAPQEQTKIENTDLPLSGNTGLLSKTGYVFNGWNTASDGSGTHYNGTDSYSSNSNATFYAEWDSRNCYRKSDYLNAGKPATLTIPASFTSIDNSAFFNNTDLKSITIPSQVKTIGEYAFFGCTELKSISMAGVTSIGASAFIGCTTLRTITIPSSVTAIGDYAFLGCTNLAVILDEGITKAYDFSFSDCTGMTSLTLPTSLKSIGYHAFCYCTGLTSVTIPKNVTFIGYYSFKGCTKLSTIRYAGTIAQWKAISIDASWDEEVPATVVHCSDGDVTL